MKTIIIDGNNLIHKVDKFKKLFDKDRSNAQSTLTEALKTRVTRSLKLVLVFDGHSDKKMTGVIYSGIKTADEIIRQYIEENYNRIPILVVSSDRGITNLAKLCGCEIKKSEAFWNEIDKEVKTLKSIPSSKNINELFNEGKEKPEKISKKELIEFKRYFT